MISDPLRSIPVCTGLPHPRDAPSGPLWVYPRVYGATRHERPRRPREIGLSPCVRGYRIGLALADNSPGSIPVCTGLPIPDPPAPNTRRVYPRVYGATVEYDEKPDWTEGLSPCVRGYHGLNDGCIWGLGSIPVCTGLPRDRRRPRPGLRVYPRVYGATAVQYLNARAAQGLSPCVRGYRMDAAGVVLCTGSIPVCTGLPQSSRPIGKTWGVYPRVYGATRSLGSG